MSECVKARFNHCVLEYESQWDFLEAPWLCQSPEEKQDPECQFKPIDRLFQWCKDQNMGTHMHALLWYGQAPPDIKELDKKAELTDDDKDHMKKRLTDHINNVCGHYKKTDFKLVDTFVVVNEALNDNNGTMRYVGCLHMK